jgi:hypothetical protein
MGILDKIKKEIKRSSSSFNLEFYLKDGDKAKVRFLKDFEDAIGLKWHDKYKAKIDTPCLEYYGKECKFCNGEIDDLRTRENFIWPIYNYEEEMVQFFRFAANSFTPVPQLMTMYESYGTLLNRDFEISRSGTSFDISYQVVPLDKSDFEKDAEAPSEKEIFKQIADIHNVEFEMKKKKSSKKVVNLEDDDKNDEDYDTEDFNQMKAPWEDDD